MINYINYNKTLCEKITELRKIKGLTQDVLADKLGLTFQAVSKWETGLSCPDITLLPVLANIFEVSIDYLFGITKTDINSSNQKSEITADISLPWENDEKLRAVLFIGKKFIDIGDISESIKKQINEFVFVYNGKALDVISHFNVNCNDVGGNVNAGDSVNCGNVDGSINAGDSVSCKDVGGDVNAGDIVNCGNVGGDVNAGDGVSCGNVGGDINADNDIEY